MIYLQLSRNNAIFARALLWIIRYEITSIYRQTKEHIFVNLIVKSIGGRTFFLLVLYSTKYRVYRRFHQYLVTESECSKKILIDFEIRFLITLQLWSPWKIIPYILNTIYKPRFLPDKIG